MQRFVMNCAVKVCAVKVCNAKSIVVWVICFHTLRDVVPFDCVSVARVCLT